MARAYTFDPHELHSLVRQTVAWRNEQETKPDLQTTFDHLLDAIEARYPGALRRTNDWIFTYAGGFSQVVNVVHVSFGEYLILTGTPLPSGGTNGPYRSAELWDIVIDGEIDSFREGEFGREVAGPGDIDHLAPADTKSAEIPSHLWVLEYARGKTLTMLPIPLAGTLFNSLNYRAWWRLGKIAAAEMVRNYFRRKLPGGQSHLVATPWRNWVGNVCCRPERAYDQPYDLEQLVAVVKQAHAAGKRLRVVGGGFSWSPVAATDEWMVGMTHLNRQLGTDAGVPPLWKSRPVLEVEAGMTIGDLTQIARKRGMVFKSPTVITWVTVGGMIACGAHGTGRFDQAFGDAVIEFTVIRADGTIVKVSADRPEDADDMRALRVNLGSLGIVYSVKIVCEWDFTVHAVDEFKDLDESIERLPALIEENDYLEFFTFPYTKTAWIKRYNRVDLPPRSSRIQKTLAKLHDLLWEKLVGPPALRFTARYLPRFTPAFMRLATAVQPRIDTVERANRTLHYERYYPKCIDMSFAIRWDQSRDAWRFLVDAVNAEGARGHWPVNMVLHARFMQGSDAYLSPSRAEKTCYIEMLCIHGTPNWEPFFRSFEERFIERFPNALPHWGKIYYDTARLRASYGADLDRFLEVRERWDPSGMFLNEFVEREVFQLAPQRERAA